MVTAFSLGMWGGRICAPRFNNNCLITDRFAEGLFLNQPSLPLNLHIYWMESRTCRHLLLYLRTHIILIKSRNINYYQNINLYTVVRVLVCMVVCEMEETRVLSRRGLRRGCHSSDFPLSHLAEAVQNGVKGNVYLELDTSDQLCARGGVSLAVCRSRLAPAAPHATALLCLEPGARLRVRLVSDTPPMHEMMLWFDEVLLAHLDMPFLTLRNITGKKNYSCHECGTEFEHPNPLKTHLFLSCQPYDPHVFWRRCIIKLQTALSTTVSPLPTLPITSDPAQLEALAAAWGRSRDGHVCLYCGKLYSRKYGLKIHIRTHTGYKPLRCRHCLRAFGDPSNLNKHVRLHASSTGSGEIHACTLCHKPLARKRDLLRHLRAHHPHALSSKSDT